MNVQDVQELTKAVEDDCVKVYESKLDTRKFLVMGASNWNLCWQRMDPLTRYIPSDGVAQSLSQIGYLTLCMDDAVIVLDKKNSFPDWAIGNGFRLATETI